jgi:hypothetical protein
MKIDKLLAIALVTLVTLTVVSGADIITMTKAAAVTPTGPTDYGTALGCTSLQWTAVSWPRTSSASFSRAVFAETGPPTEYPDGAGVHFQVIYFGGNTLVDNVAMLNTTVSGPGTISWWWAGTRLGLGWGGSQFKLVVDNRDSGKSSTMSVIGTYDSYNVTGQGSHTLNWCLDNPAPGAAGLEINTFLASVTWTPAPSTAHKISAQLSATAAPTVVARPITISGTLTTAGGPPITFARIQLQKNVGGIWTNVTGKTATTTTTGRYSISTSEPIWGIYKYRTTYAGNGTYASTNSPSVYVLV